MPRPPDEHEPRDEEQQRFDNLFGDDEDLLPPAAERPARRSDEPVRRAAGEQSDGADAAGGVEESGGADAADGGEERLDPGWPKSQGALRDPGADLYPRGSTGVRRLSPQGAHEPPDAHEPQGTRELQAAHEPPRTYEPQAAREPDRDPGRDAPAADARHTRGEPSGEEYATPRRADRAGRAPTGDGGGRDGRRRGRAGGDGGRRLVPAGNVLLAILVGLFLASLLNADRLERTAKALPIGAQRTFAVAAVRPLTAVSHALFFDRPAELADSLLGKDDFDESNTGSGLADLGKPTATPKPKPSASATEGPDGEPSPSPSVSGSTTLTTPTRAAPLRLWVGGDSLAQTGGAAVVNQARATKVMKATLDYRISTGLSRPDYFNWPKHLRAEMDTLQPDAAVCFFGANDGQGVDYGGKVLQFGTTEWVKLYHKRVGEAMDIALRDGATRVYWVSLPIMRSSEFSRVVSVMNKVYKEEAAKHDGVVYVDMWSLFSKNGAYAPYLPDAAGKLQPMRSSDGIHMSLWGGERQAGAILDAIKKDCGLK